MYFGLIILCRECLTLYKYLGLILDGKRYEGLVFKPNECEDMIFVLEDYQSNMQDSHNYDSFFGHIAQLVRAFAW